MTGNGRKRGRRQRGELVVAATEYVIEHGLSSLSLRPLAEALGISHRTLLYHFGSKEQLFQEILREARTQERLRAVSGPEGSEGATDFPTILRETWGYLSAPPEHRFWRFYFEVHGLALQSPERYGDLLHGGVDDWLTTVRDVLSAEGLPDEQTMPLATLLLATFRGLMLDLLSTGERERVDAGFEVLAGLAEMLAAAGAQAGEASSEELP